LLNSVVPFESRSLLLFGGDRTGSSFGTSKAASVKLSSLFTISLLRNVNIFTASVSTKDGSAKEYFSFSQLLSELLGQSFKCGIGVVIVILGLDKEVNNDGTLVNGNHFDGAGMDSKDCGNAISELDGTTIGIEFVHGPVKTNFTLDSVLGFDGKGAAGPEVHLENVLNTNEAVFSTSSLLKRFITASLGVPFADFLYISIQVYGVSSSVGIRNFDQNTASISDKFVAHFARRSTSIGDSVIITTLNESREARQTELSRVETIPHMVHSGVELDSVIISITLDIDGLHGSIPGVAIKRLEKQNSQLFVLTEETIPFFTRLATTEAATSIVLRNDLEVLTGNTGLRTSLVHSSLDVD